MQRSHTIRYLYITFFLHQRQTRLQNTWLFSHLYQTKRRWGCETAIVHSVKLTQSSGSETRRKLLQQPNILKTLIARVLDWHPCHPCHRARNQNWNLPKDYWVGWYSCHKSPKSKILSSRRNELFWKSRLLQSWPLLPTAAVLFTVTSLYTLTVTDRGWTFGFYCWNEARWFDQLCHTADIQFPTWSLNSAH